MRTLTPLALFAGMVAFSGHAECTVQQQSATELSYKAFAAANQPLPARNFLLQFQVRCTEPLQTVRFQSVALAPQVFIASQSQPNALAAQGIQLQVQLRDFRAQPDGQGAIPLQLSSELHAAGLEQAVRLDINYHVHATAPLQPTMDFHGELLVQVGGSYSTVDAERIVVPVQLLFNPD